MDLHNPWWYDSTDRQAVIDALADFIAQGARPDTVLEIGDPSGELVKALRARGVEAWRLIREGAPFKPRAYCQVGSLTSELPYPHYDLIICLGELENLEPDAATRVVENLCRHSDDIWIAVLPQDTIYPLESWAGLFDRVDFIHDLDFEPPQAAPWVIRYQRAQVSPEQRLACYERRVWQLQREVISRRNLAAEYIHELAQEGLERPRLVSSEGDVQYWREAAYRARAELDAVLNSTTWRMIAPIRRLRERIIPVGSHRENFLRMVWRAITILFREGPISLFRRVRIKAFWQTRAAYQNIRYRLAPPSEAKFVEVEEINARPPTLPRQAGVDIVICVHNALYDVQCCLAAVSECTNAPYSLILVDDGSQVETRDYLIEFTRRYGCKLICNEKARGYTLAANQGLSVSSAEFVVLLNSDAIVTTAWLDRMVACAQSNTKIGLVGPLSNQATWQSIPETFQGDEWAENPLPLNVSIPQVGEWVARYSWCLYPQMKFLNGFCLLIRRQVIEEVGYFDEENFGVGYGEENDYCLRARKAGWQLTLADDAYVYHAMSRSYNSERRKRLSERANMVLAQKHGQPIIDEDTTDCRYNRVLLGIRAHSRYYAEREALVDEARKRFAGRRVLFLLPVGLAGGGANVIVLTAQLLHRMGIDAHIMNLPVFRTPFEQVYPELDVPILYCEAEDVAEAAIRYDAVVATLNTTVAWIVPAVAQKPELVVGYYIQDYEPYFYPPDTKERKIAYDSYTLLTKLVRGCTTQWIYDEIQRHHQVPCHIIGAAYDTDLFWPRPRPGPEWPDRPLRIAAMIRPNSERRSPLLTMEILSKASKIYGARLEFKLFGTLPTDPGFEPLPKDFPWELGGELRPKQVANLLNESDIFVDYSSFQALGITALEAMSCGVAVIVPQNGGVHTFARPEENCLLVDTSDPQACLQALQRLIDDHALRTRLQRNAIPAVAQFHLEGPTFKLLEALFPTDR